LILGTSDEGVGTPFVTVRLKSASPVASVTRKETFPGAHVNWLT
jgi:hypothetical protein